jgi:ATP-binding cassette subfamily F protein uup
LLQNSIEALSDALRAWGKKDGAVIVVSHDRTFCDSVGFNTVGTVKDGSLTVEERTLNDSDWKRYDMENSVTTGGAEDEPVVVELTPEQKAEEKRRRKIAFNAPKTIKKLERQIEQTEEKIAELDEKMMTVGNDVGKLTEISKQKEDLEAKVAKMMEEWEECEEVLAEFA